MLPSLSPFIKTITADVVDYMFLNTVKRAGKEGLSSKRLKEIGNLPPSKIYRVLKKMEEDGFVAKEPEKEHHGAGRPQHLYRLTPEGSGHLDELAGDFKEILGRLSLAFPGISKVFNVDEFIDNLVFFELGEPLELLLQKDIPGREKLERLNEIESRIEEFLAILREKKANLEKELD